MLRSGRAWFVFLPLLPPASLMMTLQIALDGVVILVALLNSLSRPYRRATDVLAALIRDGLLTFIVSSRLGDNLIISD